MRNPVKSVVLFIAFVSILMIGTAFSVRAYDDGTAIKTDKTDRTLIKEIHAHQEESLQILKNIKAELKILRACVNK